MHLRHKLLALGGAAAVIASMGVGGTAYAVNAPISHGPVVATHHHHHKKKTSPAKSDPTCVITPSPSTFTETGLGATASSVAYIFEVECKPVYGEQTVEIDAFQLSNACHSTLSWYSATATDGTAPGTGTGASFNVVLDDDGNATAVVWGGPSCAATTDLVTATLAVAPYTIAKTHVTIDPPIDTPEGLTAYPANEVEDSTTSSVATIFYAEYPSVFSENTVEFSDATLYDRCAGGITWVGPDEIVLGTGKSVETTLDDNGNAFVVALAGPSCASGYAPGQADLVGPPYTTYGASFHVLSPRPTV